MDKVIKMLREQMILCSRLTKLFDEIIAVLKNSDYSAGITSSVQAIEKLMRDLSKNDIEIQEFLSTSGAGDLKSFIESQAECVERSVAKRLIVQVGNFQKQLRQQIIDTAHLMVNSKTFIDYNFNVMTQAVANDIYGPPGAERAGMYKRRAFEANV